MSDCVFCKIVSKEIPAHIVYEDETYLGFLDAFPRVKGHTLLIPKEHYQWVYDVPNFGEYWETALKVTRALQKAFKPDFISYGTHGLEVPHAHIHILPRMKSNTTFFPKQVKVSEEEMGDIASMIRAHIHVPS